MKLVSYGAPGAEQAGIFHNNEILDIYTASQGKISTIRQFLAMGDSAKSSAFLATAKVDIMYLMRTNIKEAQDHDFRDF